MANKPSTLEKQELRTKIWRSLASTDRNVRRDWSSLLCDKLTNWLSLNEGIGTIATYAAVETEADLSALHLSLLGQHRFAYPLVSGSNLSFHMVQHPCELRYGTFNIPEPVPEIHPPVSTQEIDLCLCPGVGFTLGGARLGRGKAYYDTTLPLLNGKAFRMGVGFDLQLRDELPVEDHDIPMTHIATPSGIRPTPEY
ncbi:MAG: 5-formyltetrahydrofolate cyclo-ligase [Roseibacillus sp.]|nr:5-formyltetrahydrofolate cyclo-ligase [Roseibacillus sp.]